MGSAFLKNLGMIVKPKTTRRMRTPTPMAIGTRLRKGLEIVDVESLIVDGGIGSGSGSGAGATYRGGFSGSGEVGDRSIAPSTGVPP